MTSLLVGIALDRSLLVDLDAQAFSFFREYDDLQTPEKDHMTPRHLLTMSSGLAWDERGDPYDNPSNSLYQMWAAPRADYFILQQPLAASPGTVFNYNSGELVEPLPGDLTQYDAEQIPAAAATLFDPLGIENWEWDGSAGFNPSASAGLRLRPRVLAKIGQLVLERGWWHGQQIVSSSWIEDSTTPRLSGEAAGFSFLRPEGITSYGYLWWLGRSPPEHPERDMIAGSGYGGQRVFILPSLDMVVVTTAGLYVPDTKADRLDDAQRIRLSGGGWTLTA